MSNLHFGQFEIDTDAQELRESGERVELTPQAVRALALLVRNAGVLVTRDELYKELWPHGGVDVDRGLNTLIRHIRLALGDDASDPRFIRTYPRRGYRFLIDRSSESSAGTDPPERNRASASAAAGSGHGVEHGRWWRWRRVAAGLALVGTSAALALVFLSWRRAVHAPDQPGTSASVQAAADELPSALREKFLEGVYLAGHVLPQRRAEAVVPLSDVVAGAPEFGAGHAWLSDALFWAGRLEDARAAAQRAIDLDPAQARAFVVRGTVQLVRDWDPSRAEADLRTAVSLSPGEPEPHHALAFALATMGRHADAIRELETAYRLDPTSSVVAGDLGLIYLYAGDLERAADYCQRAAVLEPGAEWAVGCAFDALAQRGQYAAARPLAVRLIDGAGDSPERVLGSGTPNHDAIQRFRGWRAERAGRSFDGGGSAWGAALALADAGRAPDAISALRRAAEERGIGYVTITIDPRLRPLWSDPAFQALASDLIQHGFAPLRS